MQNGTQGLYLRNAINNSVNTGEKYRLPKSYCEWNVLSELKCCIVAPWTEKVPVLSLAVGNSTNSD